MDNSKTLGHLSSCQHSTLLVFPEYTFPCASHDPWSSHCPSLSNWPLASWDRSLIRYPECWNLFNDLVKSHSTQACWTSEPLLWSSLVSEGHILTHILNSWGVCPCMSQTHVQNLTLILITASSQIFIGSTNHPHELLLKGTFPSTRSNNSLLSIPTANQPCFLLPHCCHLMCYLWHPSQDSSHHNLPG